jgi:aminopeptidase-like protein
MNGARHINQTFRKPLINMLSTGIDLHQFAAELFPICRSITGEGVRKTIARIGDNIPLQVTEVPSGTEVFDWTIPKEWNIRDAYIKDAGGRKVVDFGESSLRVVSYSIPVRPTRMRLSALKEHLHTLPEHPDWIPYRTSYYKEDWGFCLPHAEMERLSEDCYEVCIDSSLENGHLTYAECFIAGQVSDEILISTHICHPSLANDNLSGIVISTALAQRIVTLNPRYSYRFLFIPGTIGAITWLALNQEKVEKIKHGLVLTGVGNRAGFHYKRTRRGDAEIDRVAAYVLKSSGEPHEILDFSPYGYDERQYCSPGFNLPVGCLMRSVWGTFPEYHTSADNLDFISAESLEGTLTICLSILEILEKNEVLLNTNPFCEPQLGKRGLYRSTGGESIGTQINARLWVLNFSDGKHSLLDIAERSGLPFHSIHDAAAILKQNGLLQSA